jgi:hypothetical protein
MTVEVREYGTEAQRLLVESSFSPTEIARLTGRPRQRVSDWRTGRCRPTQDDRVALERTIGVPARMWDAPPTRRAPAPASDPAASPGEDALSGASVPGVDLEDLPALGLGGLARLASRLRALEPTLPPRDRVSALQAEARVLAVHEGLRQRSEDARAAWLASAAFLDEIRTLLAAVPGVAAEQLRLRLAALGVSLPPPPSPAAVAEDPPRTVADVDELLSELETAKGFSDASEPMLALAHVFGLGIDAHADAIAALVLDDATRAGRLLELLDGADRHVMRTAIARAMAVRAVQALPADVRRAVAELLDLLGHAELSRKVIGGLHGHASA